jgi:hypothetical protein|tara:strand:- start:806 stop:3061 length:2256 start_codon:yes stop_codon:yes gene_type:complete
MEDFDKYLDRLVENFYDTGKLVLNENYWTDTVNIFSNLRNNPQTIKGLLDRYESIRNSQYYSHNFDDLNDLMVNDQIPVLDFIEGLESDDIDEEQYSEDGVIFPQTDNPPEEIYLDGEEVDIDLDNSGETINSDDYFYKNTPSTIERIRKEQIEQDNESDLPLLSVDREIDTEDKENNLKTLQYILLNNFKTENGDFIDLEGMKSEINNGIFGDVTKTYVEFLQSEKGMAQNGEVNNAVWNIALGLLSNRENEKFGEKKEITNELKEILSFQYKKNDNIKEKLNKLSSMRLFNNLVDFGIYKLDYKRTDDDIKKDLEGLVEKYKTVEGEVPKLNKLKKDIIDIDDKITFMERNPKSFRKKIEELKKEKKPLEDKIKEYKKFKDIISQSRSGTPQSKEESLQKFIDIKKQSDERTIKGLFGKLKEVFDRSVENKGYSLDVINNLITRINDTLYVIHEKDILNKTKKNKSKKALKTIINSINLDKDIEEIISGLERINKRTYEHVLYELSFCECEDNEGINYFRDCGSSLGNRSILLSAGNTPLKNLIDSTLTVTECVESLYSEIMRGAGRSIVKHDITSNREINLGGLTIAEDTHIEVKRVSLNKIKTEGFTFSEFFAIYKNEPDRTNYYTPEKFNRYNGIISSLVKKLKDDGDDGIKDLFESTGGIFLKDYMFYPKGSYELVWSDYSDRSQIKKGEHEDFLDDEKRLTVRFEITGEGYQWVEGNCNLQQNESTDSLDNIIENFFDTGKFVI